MNHKEFLSLCYSEGLGASSQKTNLLGGVAQILITQDHPIPTSSRCGTICLTQIPTISLSNKESQTKSLPTSSRCGTICLTQIPTIPPRTKSLPCKLNYLHTGKSNAPSRSYLHWVKRRHALCEAPITVDHSSTPRGKLYAHCKGAALLNFSRARH